MNGAYRSVSELFRAINFVDPTKYGFRVILLDSFLEAHLSPTQIPTLFLSAIPLKSGEALITKVFYPDNIREDKQVILQETFYSEIFLNCFDEKKRH